MNDGTQGASAQPGRIGHGAEGQRASNRPAAVALPGVRQSGARRFGRARRASAGDAESRGLSRPGLGSSVAARILIALAATFVALALPSFAVAAPPQLTIDPVSDESIVTAHVSGTVDADGIFSEWWFEVSTESGEFTRFNVSGTTEGSDPEAVSGTLEGLAPAKSHELRLAALNYEEFVTEYSPIETFTTDPAVAPTLTLGPAEDITGTSAHLAGTVDPEGGNTDATAGPLPIVWELQVNREEQNGEDDEGWITVGSDELTGTEAESNDPIDVEADATNLIPNSHYQYRLVVRYAGLEIEEVEAPGGTEAAFDTPAIAPSTDEEGAIVTSPTSARIRALVHPHNSALTDCHFAYGLAGGSLDHAVSCATVPAPGSFFLLNRFTAVAADISGLAPSTAYEFRLLATNSAGTTEGDTLAFTTLTSQSCGNEEIRDAQHVTHLPDCRAYEMVSPLQKGNGDIVGDGGTNIASTDGNAITLATRTPFGDTIGSGVAGQTQYIASRGPDGWTAHSITPQPRPEEIQTFFGFTRYQAFSDDLRSAVVWGYDFPAATGGVPFRTNIYVEDTPSRALHPVTISQGGFPDPLPPLFELINNFNWGVSADARHVAFVSRARYLSDLKQAQERGEQSAGAPNLYQWDDGVLSLAGILPGGTIPPGGSDAPLANYRASMSEDGRRLLFSASAGGEPQLYQRIDGEETAWVSEPEIDPGDPDLPADYRPDPAGVSLKAATPDGRNVFFTTASPLLIDDTNEASDLYRWTASADPTSDNNLTRITENGFDGEFIGMSDDGDRIYYLTLGSELFVWDHGVTHLISTSVEFPTAQDSLAVNASPGLGRVTPDGRYLAFISNGAVKGIGATGEQTSGQEKHYEMYFYELGGALRCISCPSGPAAADASIVPSATAGVITYFLPGIRPRFLADDGRTFFSTAEALVPEDINGVADTYQYGPATGSLTLLSTGKGADPATFTDASTSGDDVFLVTPQRFVPTDADRLVDLYDVRAGGGYAEPLPAAPPLPCHGDPCQGSATSTPLAVPPSSAAQGSGNVREKRGTCRKGSRRVRRNRKVRCLKSHRRTADQNRRAGR